MLNLKGAVTIATYTITEFGAVGDSRTNDAGAIQQAIDACAAAGGGTVLVPAGKVFRSGTLVLKSNVELSVERGATLLASDDPADYQPRYTDRGYLAFLAAEWSSNIAITGGGTIDGCGRGYIDTVEPYIYRMKRQRPFTIFCLGCSKVTMRDVTVQDAAVWTVRLSGCEDVVIHAIRILNDLRLPNNDGIDLDRCRHVRISDCHIVCGDDCICLKTCQETAAYGGACEHITVTGCTLISTSCALMIGCEAREPMRHVIFDACVVHSSHRGLAIHLSEESDVEDVLFSNIMVETRIFNDRWWGRGEPIYITAIPWTEQHQIGHVRRVRFSNILCRSEHGVLIQGWEPGLIDTIQLVDVRVELNKWSKWAGGQHDLRPCPGTGLVEHPIAGFYIKNAANVTLRNCEVIWGEHRPDYFTHALETENVANLTLENFKGEAAHPERDPAIITG